MGNLQGVSFTRDSERRMKVGVGGVLAEEHLSLWQLHEGNLEGRLLHWGPRRICEVRLWK